MNKHLDDSANDIKNTLNEFNDSLRKAAENSENVKEGRCTVEEQMQEPGFILFNGISETSIKLLQDPEISKIFDILTKELKDESVKALVNLLVLTMTHSAYNSIIFYDDLLKMEIRNQFDNIIHATNETMSTVAAHHGVLEVFKKRIGEIEKKLQIDEFKSKNNVGGDIVN